MLEALQQCAIQSTLFRLANPRRFRGALMELGTTFEEALETIEFIGAPNLDDATEMLQMPFDDPVGYTPGPTRFSDGSWRVLYAALEPDTADAERGYWCVKELQSEPAETRRFAYRELRCRLVGAGYDLRPLVAENPFLIGNHEDYPRCQDVAREARRLDADAFLSASARKEGGTTVPVFNKRGLSDPAILGVVVFEIGNDGGVRPIRPER